MTYLRPPDRTKPKVTWPRVVAHTKLRGLLGSAGTVTGTLFTAITRGAYRVSVYEQCYGSASTGTLQTTIGWTDRAEAVGGLSSTNPSWSFTALDITTYSRQHDHTVIEAYEGSAITYSIAWAGLTGADPICDVTIVVEEVARG